LKRKEGSKRRPQGKQAGYGRDMAKNALFSITGLIAVFSLYCILQFGIPLSPMTGTVEVYIEKGSTFKKAAEVLYENGLIRDKRLFTYLGKITGVDRRLKPGYYSFTPPDSPWDVFKSLRDGNTIKYTLTVVEGDTLDEIESKLAGNGIMDEEEFRRLSSDRDFLASLNISAPSLEGYLFPDTYRIPKGTPAGEVLKAMVDRLRENFDSAMLERTYELGMDINGVLTLASIIEREAAVDGERPVISAVFHNRLVKGIPLQADPTSIYGVKAFSKGVKKKDLLRKTTYNTYIIKGLPPGPIASAGLKSIKAALYPADAPYLYFVSNYDGTHTFSSTLKEHLAAVEASRLKRQEAEDEAPTEVPSETPKTEKDDKG
jgi:UPF0755 protein